jgi:hypothetical protein
MEQKTLNTLTDRIKDEASFRKQVEEDAISFKPMGEKIHSYFRKRGSYKGKDPRDRAIRRNKKEEVHEDDEDAITYEVYHVSSTSLPTATVTCINRVDPCRPIGPHPDS